jgi:phytoene synthase
VNPPDAATSPEACEQDATRIIRAHSKSFALASRLLSPKVRGAVVDLYAFCRRADDAVDCTQGAEPRTRLEALRRELDSIYAGERQTDPILAGFQAVARASALPQSYPSELLEGLRMDVSGHRYRSMDDLYRYCWCVAGTVGVMMCHVLGVDTPSARVPAAHLGIAMQLSNISRDVLEDWERERLYLPEELLEAHGASSLARHVGGPFPRAHREAVARAVVALVRQADRYYRSGDRGMVHLSWRSRLSVRTARFVYAAIGERLLGRRGDVLSGRVVVPRWHKLLLLLRAGVAAVAELPGASQFRAVPLHDTITFPDDVGRP